MKNHFIALLLWSLPLMMLAQNEPAVKRDFYTGVRSATSIVFDDHVNIMQVNTDDENFDVLAINDQMQTLWRSSFTGYPISVAKFKGKIIAIAATGHSTQRGNSNTYKAYLIDPASGTRLLEKVIYEADDDYMEFPAVFTGDGSYCKLVVRKTGLERRLVNGLSMFFIEAWDRKYSTEINATRDLSVISLNQKLDVDSIQLDLPRGLMVTWCANSTGDLFFAWLSDTSLKVFRYKDGSRMPGQPLATDLAFDERQIYGLKQLFLLTPSKVNPNAVYYGASYINSGHETEVGIGKLDFLTEKKLFTSMDFDKNNIRALEKSFVPVNKKINDPNLGGRFAIGLRRLEELSGTLIAVVKSHSMAITSTGVGYNTEYSALISGYRDDLATKFQQILPANKVSTDTWTSAAFHADNNKLYILDNQKSGMRTNEGVYGCLDLNTGQWEKMEILSKKKLDTVDDVDGPAVLWFAGSFIVVYCRHEGFSVKKHTLTLQQNFY